MSLTDASEAVTFLTDEAGRIAAWNPACALLFGLAQADAVGQPLARLLDGAPGWRALADAGGGQVRLLTGPGQQRGARLSLHPQFDAGGAALAWSVTIAPFLDGGIPDTERVGRTPLAEVVELLPGTFYAINREGRFVLWNHNLERMCEMMPDELAAAHVLDMFDLRERTEAAEKIRRVFDEGAEVSMEASYVSRSGRETPILLGGARVVCDGHDYLFGMGIDISVRRERESRLHLVERALRAASNGVVITGRSGRDNPIEYVNPAFENITGYSAAEVLGHDSRFMAAPGMDANERSQVRQALAERRPIKVVMRNLRKNGEIFWNELSITPVHNEHGDVSHFIGIVVDVTAVKERTAHLEHEVNHDALTGLANRNLLWDRLGNALHLAHRHQSMVAVVLVDLDNFKSINDTFGHAAGDVVLKVVARRLQAAVRDSDTVARMSGDEFVLVLVDQPSLRYTLRMVERLRRALVMPVSFSGSEIPVGASLGVASYPHDGRAPAEMVRSADMAMYRAKGCGGGVQFFSTEMRTASEARAALSDNMRSALARDELFLLFQPRIDARSGTVRGFEALLRWRHPEHGVMLPAAFLAEAEESGQIVEIGGWVLEQACAFLRQLSDAGYPDLPVAVNASHREYSRPDFTARIAARLERFGLPPGCLEIEISEADLIRCPGLGRELAAQLRDVGAVLSIDEFGRGISDLSFLQQLSVRQVKLSKAAVHGIADEVGGASLAKALIDIGHNLDMAVVGEAVETQAQVEFLTSHGCDQLQGLWFSEPLEAAAAERLLAQRQHAA